MKTFIYGFTFTLLCSFLVVGCNKTRRHYTVEDETARAEINLRADELENDLEELAEAVRNLHESTSLLLGCCAELEGEVRVIKEDLAETQANIENITNNIAQITSSLSHLEENVGGITKDGDNLIIEGCNLVVRDGNGEEPLRPGVGNILVGRDKSDDFAEFFGRSPNRTGTNNIIVGGSNEYSGHGGLCVGALNQLEGNSCTVLSCENKVTGDFSTITGGTNGVAQGRFSCVSGGLNRSVSNDYDWRAGNFFQTR